MAIPWTSGPGLKRTHEIAALEIAKRPVFVYPDLLAKDSLLNGEAFALLPDHLLFRVWPRETAPLVTDEGLLASARALAAPAVGAGCEGCLLPPPEHHPTQEMQIVHAYEAAALNHARAVAAIPEAGALIPALLARARGGAGDEPDDAQRGAESRSRKSSSSSR